MSCAARRLAFPVLNSLAALQLNRELIPAARANVSAPRFLLAVAAIAVSASMASNAAASTIKGSVIVASAADSGDVVVYIDKVPDKTFPPPEKPAVLDQFRLTFVPHVLPVLVGTTVAFPNSDEVRHNVFSPSPPKFFNLGTYPRGVTRMVTFDKPGEVVLLCNVHPEMSAYIVVVETPYFAVTRRDGSFEIRDVPEGTYTLSTWREGRKSLSTTVVVASDKGARVRLVLK